MGKTNHGLFGARGGRRLFDKGTALIDKLLKLLQIIGVVFLIVGGLALSPFAAALIVPIGVVVRLFGSPAALAADSPYE